MVSEKEVLKQLKKLNFNPIGWGRREVRELQHILLPDEQIYELANGIYEGGFALVVATDIRVLLVDKKPLNYLTVEDLRFDMINEIDYSHRLLGATINIATGNKNLRFRSYNQQRLRKLIGHVQHCMAESKRKESTHQEGQVAHLEKINQQLRDYLQAQQQAAQASTQQPLKPNPELADYLYAQSLMAQYQQMQQPGLPPQFPQAQPAVAAQPQPEMHPQVVTAKPAPPVLTSDDIYDDGMKEVFGKHQQTTASTTATPQPPATPPTDGPAHHYLKLPEVNPFTIAYSKLPMALRNRKFGRPLLPDQMPAGAPAELSLTESADEPVPMPTQAVKV